MIRGGALDRRRGFIILHRDPLGRARHIFHEGKMYNGFGATLVSSKGANEDSITYQGRDGRTRRAARHPAPLRSGGSTPTDAIQAAELAACAEAQGVAVGEGDFVLVRTGHWRCAGSSGGLGDYAGGPAPGFGVSAADFFCRGTWPP